MNLLLYYGLLKEPKKMYLIQIKHLFLKLNKTKDGMDFLNTLKKIIQNIMNLQLYLIYIPQVVNLQLKMDKITLGFTIYMMVQHQWWEKLI
jgi:hypothetical protein